MFKQQHFLKKVHEKTWINKYIYIYIHYDEILHAHNEKRIPKGRDQFSYQSLQVSPKMHVFKKSMQMRELLRYIE